MADSGSSIIPEWLTLIAGGGGVGVAVTQFFGWLTGRRKAEAAAGLDEARADEVLSGILNQSVRTLIEGYQKRVEELTGEIHLLRAEIGDMREARAKEVSALSSEIIELRKALDARRDAVLPNGFT